MLFFLKVALQIVQALSPVEHETAPVWNPGDLYFPGKLPLCQQETGMFPLERLIN